MQSQTEKETMKLILKLILTISYLAEEENPMAASFQLGQKGLQEAKLCASIN
jgi:hypothetical protein